MIIFGAGMSGCIAGIVNRSQGYPIRIFEAGASPQRNHKAVLRFRDDSVGRAVGIPFRKVHVTKSIWADDREVTPSPRWDHLYAAKVTGRITQRSIGNIDAVTRWIAPADFHDQMLNKLNSEIVYNHQITGIRQDGVIDMIGNGFEDCAVRDPKDEPIISTLPIDTIAKLVGMEDLQPQWDYTGTSILVSHYKIHNCDTFTTVYFPMETQVYRASINGNILIVESIDEMTDWARQTVCKALGIRPSNIQPIFEDVIQQRGKITPLEETARRRFLFQMTAEYGVYSLGRFATWRNVLLGDVLKDVYAINDMIDRDDYSRQRGH